MNALRTAVVLTGVAGLAGCGIPLAHEREGSYTVTVDAVGYSPWSRSGIPVIDGGCHVRTVRLTARLEQ
jgi:hypothetical protein